MKLITTTTGSYPLIPGADPEESIKRAINDQIEAGIDLLVDGQVPLDISLIGEFAQHPPEFRELIRHYPIVGKTNVEFIPTTISHYQIAKDFAKGQPVKAELPGPTFIADSLIFISGSPYKSRNDPKLIFDIARVLAKEAQALSKAGAKYIQIDEPSFAYGANIDNGFAAIGIIAQEIKCPILHVCGDIREIFDQLLSAPVTILNVEGQFLRKLPKISSSTLESHNKKIAYGCIPVNRREEPRLRHLVRELVEAVDKLGEEHLWAITPTCGLRLSELDKNSQQQRVAFRKMKLLVEAARAVEAFIERREHAYAT